MTRQVHALLIAGDDLKRIGTPTANAEPALDNIEADLRARFTGPTIKRLARAPTVQVVDDAFAEMRPQIQSGELFVVMFAGHGDPANDTRPSQSWFLTKRQYYTDAMLADRLLELDPGVDAVVISDCCYGAGFFRVGPEILRGRTRPQIDHLLLRAQSRAFARVLARSWSEAARDSLMVCISGATKDDFIAQANLPKLTAKTAAAAQARFSYSKLAAIFAKFQPAGGTYHVDARPEQRMKDVVLHT